MSLSQSFSIICLNDLLSLQAPYSSDQTILFPSNTNNGIKVEYRKGDKRVGWLHRDLNIGS